MKKISCLFGFHDFHVLEEFSEHVGIIGCIQCGIRYLHHECAPPHGEKSNVKISKDNEDFINRQYRRWAMLGPKYKKHTLFPTL